MDRVDMIYDLLTKQQKTINGIAEDVSSLKDFKNKVIGGSVACGLIFSAVFEFIKNMFWGRL